MRLHKITLLLGTQLILKKILAVDEHFVAIITRDDEQYLVNRHTAIYEGCLTPNVKKGTSLLNEYVGDDVMVTLTPAGLAALTEDYPDEYPEIEEYRQSRRAIIRKVEGNSVTISLGFFRPDSDVYAGRWKYKIPIRFIESITLFSEVLVDRDEENDRDTEEAEGAEVPDDATDESLQLVR
jgi:hypothetical protein